MTQALLNICLVERDYSHHLEISRELLRCTLVSVLCNLEHLGLGALVMGPKGLGQGFLRQAIIGFVSLKKMRGVIN